MIPKRPAIPIRSCVLVLTATLFLAPVGPLSADDDLYLKVAPSTAMIQVNNGLFSSGIGTGFLVDAKERLLVTAHHVVERGSSVVDRVTVTFAQVKDGEVITDKKHYQADAGIKGKVVYHHKRRDLALLQVERLPDGIKPLHLAERPARPGQTVHVIGQGTDKFGGLFGYSRGYVRNAFRWADTGIRVVAHQTPTNQGDSGGPVVNDKGEVVAFISVGTIGVPPANKLDPFYAVQVTDLSVCVTEIRLGLKDRLKPPVVAAEPKPVDVGPLGLTLDGTINGDSPQFAVSTGFSREKLPGKIHLVRFIGGKEYRITMNSVDLDSVLMVQDSDGQQLAWDDDSGGGLNSLLTFKAPKDGEYKLLTLSLKGTGNFTAKVIEAGKAKDNAKENPAKAAEVGNGQTFKGELGKAASIVYQVNLTQGKTYVIDMVSENTKMLDPYLILLDAGGKELARDDDSGGNLNARITHRAESTGVYQIRATSFFGVGQGPFTVTVREQK